MWLLLKSIEEHNNKVLEALVQSRPYHIAEWKWNEINRLADEFYWKMPDDDALSSGEAEKGVDTTPYNGARTHEVDL